MPGHREDVAEVITDMLRGRPEVEERVMFGVPGFLTGGKMFACVNRNGLALKLPVEAIEGLDDPAFGRFGPNSRPMRGWLLITREQPGDYGQDAALIETSIAYAAPASGGSHAEAAPRFAEEVIARRMTADGPARTGCGARGGSKSLDFSG